MSIKILAVLKFFRVFYFIEKTLKKGSKIGIQIYKQNKTFNSKNIYSKKEKNQNKMRRK